MKPHDKANFLRNLANRDRDLLYAMHLARSRELQGYTKEPGSMNNLPKDITVSDLSRFGMAIAGRYPDALPELGRLFCNGHFDPMYSEVWEQIPSRATLRYASMVKMLGGAETAREAQDYLGGGKEFFLIPWNSVRFWIEGPHVLPLTETPVWGFTLEVPPIEGDEPQILKYGIKAATKPVPLPEEWVNDPREFIFHLIRQTRKLIAP